MMREVHWYALICRYKVFWVTPLMAQQPTFVSLAALACSTTRFMDSCSMLWIQPLTFSLWHDL